MVGTKVIDVVDEGRQEVLGSKEGYRKLVIRFFYPAVDSDKKVKCEYLTEAKVKQFGKKLDMTLYNKRIGIFENVEMKEGSFPLILYSHGYGSFVEQNTDLCQNLAESGYIVASIGHSFEASETVFADGTSVKMDRSILKKMMKPLIPAYLDIMKLCKKDLAPEEAAAWFDRQQRKYESFMMDRIIEWAKDAECCLRHIHKLSDDETSFLHGKIDFSHGVGATGHSFGGALAYYMCNYNDEFSCGANIDGGLFGEYGENVNHKPFMQIVNKRNLNVVQRAHLFHDKPVHFLMFKDMTHIGFLDMKLAVDKPLTFGKADPELVMNTLNNAHIAFFDRYLKQGDTGNADKLAFDTEEIERYEMW